MKLHSFIHRPIVRDLLIFLAFLTLTIIMTWPWVTHLRDAASDPGDTYFASWVLWWDYHQTFHDPLNLFHANVFYPYRYTLALSEHDYGIAMVFFPLFALGLRPLTIHGLATLLGFAFCGYGTFRLARTLTGSNGAAWVAGITFAFIPYRFGQLPHLIYLFAGWIPILLEALVLFLRERSRRRALWLGLAFFMNGVTCIHWLVLTPIPLVLSAIVLIFRYHAWRDFSLWRRGFAAVAVAGLGLIPFLLPYRRAGELYGFVRSAQDALVYSANPIDWLVGDGLNKMWHGLNASISKGEKALFPGLLPLLLALAALFLVKPKHHGEGRLSAQRKILILLDTAAIVCGILIVTISGFGFFKLRIFGFYLLKIYSIIPVVIALILVMLTRILIAYPEIAKSASRQSLIASLRSERRSDGFWLGLIWIVIGFCGSLGMNSLFHRILFEYVPLFRAIRVPARWAMICYLGLALLAGIGAAQLTDLVKRHWPRIPSGTVYFIIAFSLLFEQRAFPLNLIHGAVDPDAVTIRLKQTPMTGGIVELPAGYGTKWNFRYVLRAADHGRPLITAFSGFLPPLEEEIDSLTQAEVIPDRFIDLLEKIPCSYLVVHNDMLGPVNRRAIETVLSRAIARDRIRFIRSFEGADLYAVSKTEPNARSEAPTPFPVSATVSNAVSEKDVDSGRSQNDAAAKNLNAIPR